MNTRRVDRIEALLDRFVPRARLASLCTESFSTVAADLVSLTGGDPDLETSAVLLEALANGGADLIEVGVPFSDPIADGPVNQRAAARALEAGTTLPGILEMIARVRTRIETPIVLFSYFNPLMAHGLQTALEDIMAHFSYHPTIRFETRIDKQIDILDNSRATHLYHIAREAVNNAVKHSKARRIGITLARVPGENDPGVIHLCISDNGRGIGRDTGRGIGLKIMEYRAKMIDARFNIETGPKGTQIHVLSGKGPRAKEIGP